MERKIFTLSGKREFLKFDNFYVEGESRYGMPGKQIFPRILPSSKGTSYTYQLSDDLFFKRKMQDGEQTHPSEYALGRVSLHHVSRADNELMGTFDDLGEVVSYHISKRIIDPKTGQPIVKIPEYMLAVYQDEKEQYFRGCATRNVCENKNQKLISMAEIMKFVGVS